MALNKFVATTDIISAQVNSNFAEAYKISALNLIRTLQDRSITFSKGSIDWFGDAYTDSNGRMNSATGSRTAKFDTNKMTCAWYGALSISVPDSGSDTTVSRGIKFSSSTQFTSIVATKLGSVTAAAGAFLYDSAHTQVGTASFSGDVATITGTFAAGNYYIECTNTNTATLSRQSGVIGTADGIFTVLAGVVSGVDDGPHL